jgi:hypothetical protein
MTVIAAYKHDNGEIWFAADSRAAGQNDAINCSIPKIGAFDGFTFGYAGSYRFGQILLYAFRPPKHPVNVATDDYMFTLWIEALREYLDTYGMASTTNGVESIGGDGDCLIAYRNEFYMLQTDLSLLKPTNPFCACGSGSAYAISVLWALHGLMRDPEDMVKLAVTCAIEHVPTCGGTILTLKHDPESTPRPKRKAPNVRKAVPSKTAQAPSPGDLDKGTDLPTQPQE